MTTEIEKELFEKYGVSLVRRCSLDSNNCPFGFSHKCSECDVDDINTYPPITAEKVLRLIELLIKNGLEIGFSYSDIHNTYHSSKDNHNVDGYLSCIEKDFMSSFYSLLIQIHKDLTPQERKEVKEILEV